MILVTTAGKVGAGAARLLAMGTACVWLAPDARCARSGTGF